MFHQVQLKKQGCCKIKTKELCAIYTHSYAYSINLLVGDTIKVCLFLKDTIIETYKLEKLVKISPKCDVKLHSIQVKNNFSCSNEDGKFIDRLKKPTIKCFVIPNGPFVSIVSKELSETLMSCKSCGASYFKTVPVWR